MANLLDYLHWRGDLPLSQTPLCDVDLLVFARLSYIPFEDILPAGFDAQTPLAEACARALDSHRARPGAALPLRDDEEFLARLIDSPRFASLRLTGYADVFDARRQEQFAALTALLPDGAVIAYRGTDGTLVGWKEDFNMAFSDAVPAQEDAARYLTQAAAACEGALWLCGHSKGGNLAVYAAAFCPADTQARITSVRNFDGPGFSAATLARPGFDDILPRVRTYLPKSSVVGMLLEHEEDFAVINSRSVGIWQHNPYHWAVQRGGFEAMESRTNSSQFIDQTLKEWVAAMPKADRERLINALYDMLNAPEGERARDGANGRAITKLRAFGSMDADTRRLMLRALRKLGGSLKSSLPAFLERMDMGSLLRRVPPAVMDRLMGAGNAD